MADATYQPKVYRKQGGDQFVVASTGQITVESGGGVVIETGGQVSVPVTTGSTAIANYGHTTLTVTTGAGDTTFNMTAPNRAGLVKSFRCTAANSSDRALVECGVQIGSTGNILAFDAADEAVMLVSESTTAWAIVSNVGSVATTS